MPSFYFLVTIMSYTRYKKIGNKEYAYEITAYWDKEKKYSRQKAKYLGIVIDKEAGIFRKVKRRNRDENGKIIRNSRNVREKFIEKEIVSFGSSYLIDKVISNDDIGKIFTDLLSDKQLTTLKSLLSFRLINNSAMYLAKDWYEGDIAKYLFFDAKIRSGAISEFLEDFGSEKLQKEFFKRYLPIATKDNKEGLIIDGTAMPNDINIPINEFGYNEGSVDKQIKFLSVISADNNMPLYFRYNSGSIADVSTINNTIKELKANNANSKSVLLDAGFYSNDNIKLLQDNNIDFIIRLPKGRNLFKDLTNDIKQDQLESLANAVKVSKKRVVFIQEKKCHINKKDVYAYIILDPKKKADLSSNYLADILDDNNNDIDDIDNQKITEKLKSKGIFVILSSKKQKKNEILDIYYSRQKVERLFAFSKSDLNLLPLRTHKESTLRGYLFLLFLLSYFFMKIHKKLKKKFTIEQSFIILSSLKAKIYENQILIQEANKKQKIIFELIGHQIPEEIARE